MGKKFIAAPFGNYLDYNGWISTVGTFTPNKRGGVFKRAYKIITTLRYKKGAWENNLGFPNPGIDILLDEPSKFIGKFISIGVGEKDNIYDWKELLAKCRYVKGIVYGFEINVSCPNMERGLRDIEMAEKVLEYDLGENVFLKLPPIGFERLVGLGYNKYHMCNTLPVKNGGRSGRDLQPYVLNGLKYIRDYEPKAEIIAGGGIYNQDDADFYFKNGANHLSIGSAWFNVFRHNKIRKIANRM